MAGKRQLNGSKLRKKLSPYPELRITNIHGKGYKIKICQQPPDPGMA